MIILPSIARILIVNKGRRGINLWLPLVLFWPGVLALGLIIAPAVIIAALATWPRYGRMLLFGGPRLFGLLCALRGLNVRVADGENRVHVYFL